MKDVADCPSPHEVVERAQRLLNRRVRIEAVDYVQVDVVGPEPTQARLAGSQDVPS
jgi:hypothetical protein